MFHFYVLVSHLQCEALFWESNLSNMTSRLCRHDCNFEWISWFRGIPSIIHSVNECSKIQFNVHFIYKREFRKRKMLDQSKICILLNKSLWIECFSMQKVNVFQQLNFILKFKFHSALLEHNLRISLKITSLSTRLCQQLYFAMFTPLWFAIKVFHE